MEIIENKPSHVLDYYSVKSIADFNGMDFLREIFPEGVADEMNFVLFSTSGIHGSYTKIEEIKLGMTSSDFTSPVTFIFIQPRKVTVRYGNATPKTEDDLNFLKRLRDSSLREISRIGVPEQKSKWRLF